MVMLLLSGFVLAVVNVTLETYLAKSLITHFLVNVATYVYAPLFIGMIL